ncbi:electron transfer flavoprotein subunit beta/FixA family protein [Acaricomes phytoseiuli]|uniref:electron transfer flavoprotein subunit beta/FixA family protein n=1 Tax=Acaricomes phytoseiuli TaxID=291968 RepID=UPI000380E6C4|nr:electron transfer flavoprotein subunit beta/FixA family protein [Acaricomes phytoseiuli]MCW1250412.1 electron transfer flavoprotein subunit beta/FixA family protein [Acaricomes phytoseiuli]
MTIAVLVKYVPDAQFDRHLTGDQGVLDRSESILSELDEYALEAALQIVEERGGQKAGNRVIAITMGPEDAATALKKALQIGAFEGVHLSDAALAGSDVAGTSLALAAVIRQLGGVDLVLCGMSSTDGETSLVPAQLAARLGLPQLTFASSLEAGEATITGTRQFGSIVEDIEVTLPAVVSVTDQANDPRYPNFKTIMAARKRPVQTMTLAELGLSPDQVGFAGAKAVVQQAAAKPPRSAGVVITDNGDAGVKLVDFLTEQKIL